MKIKLPIIWWLLLITIGCQQLTDMSKPKPVEIDGLGSLSSVKDKELNQEQLEKVFDSLGKLKKVNESDAESLLVIYERQLTIFRQNSSITDTKISKSSVEHYLKLMLVNEQLDKKVAEVSWQEANKLIEETAFSGGGNFLVGEFIALYINAYNQTIGKDKEELRDEKYDDMQDESSIVVLVAYEKTAHEIINGKRPATAEQKMRATEFINGLKEFNEKQTPSWKLLDDNGRLINPKTATTNQRAAMQKSVSENGVLGREMNPTFESLTQGITRNLKRQ